MSGVWAPCDPQNSYRNCSLESLSLGAGMRIVYRNFVFRVPQSLRVWESQSSRVSEFQSLRVPQSQNLRVSEFQSSRVSEGQKAKVEKRQKSSEKTRFRPEMSQGRARSCENGAFGTEIVRGILGEKNLGLKPPKKARLQNPKFF